MATNDGGSTYTDGGNVIIVLDQFTEPRIVTGPAGETLLVLSPPPRIVDEVLVPVIGDDGNPEEVIVNITGLDALQIFFLLVEAASDPIIGWGRWDDAAGPPIPSFDPPGSMPNDTLDGAEGGSLHYVIGQPTDLATLMMAPHNGRFRVLANTTPTGSVAITFGPDYELRFANLAATGGTFEGSGTVSSTVGCMGISGCSNKVAGLVAGSGAERGGFVYHINDFYKLNDQDMFGSVVFEQNPTGPIPPTP